MFNYELISLKNTDYIINLLFIFNVYKHYSIGQSQKDFGREAISTLVRRSAWVAPVVTCDIRPNPGVNQRTAAGGSYVGWYARSKRQWRLCHPRILSIVRSFKREHDVVGGGFRQEIGVTAARRTLLCETGQPADESCMSGNIHSYIHISRVTSCLHAAASFTYPHNAWWMIYLYILPPTQK